MLVAPCKNCKDRKQSCHSTCKKYIEWKIEWEKLKAEEKEARSLDWYSKSINDAYDFRGNFRRKE